MFVRICIYSKNTRVKLDLERVHWGQTPFRVNDDLEIGQPDAEYDPELGQSAHIICQVCGKLTDLRVILDPEWSLAPMDPFRVKFDPGVFRVYSTVISCSSGLEGHVFIIVLIFCTVSRTYL